MLRSYVQGTWHTASDDGRPLHDAVTGDEVARISSAGVDMAAALEHGRRVGGPALRELTFHQRAAPAQGARRAPARAPRRAVRALGPDRRDPRRREVRRRRRHRRAARLREQGQARAAQRHRLRRGAPSSRWARGGTFVGQHICTPLHGVAVQINAFNFPVWGPLEKLGPGVPGRRAVSLVKPASPTAFLTARLVELIVESGLLPEGTLQFVAGRLGDLFDHLTEQDLVSFTGSAATAATLRTHPVVVPRSVRFTAEADSLNLLDPRARRRARARRVRPLRHGPRHRDDGQGRPEVHRDPPGASSPSSTSTPSWRPRRRGWPRSTVGNPASEGVRMGALASLEQREEVRRGGQGPRRRRADRVRRPGAGRRGRRRRRARRVRLADPAGRRPGPGRAARGGGVRPGLDRPALRVHRAGDRAGRTRAGQPGRARSSPPTRRSPARSCSASRPGTAGCWYSTPATRRSRPGTARRCRVLVHGGPGRAGGGEEMGGIRGVLHHMQRTAVQADPRHARRDHRPLGRRRRTRTSTDVHPFRKHLEELRPGDTVVAGPRTVTLEDVEHFAEFTGDTFYAHMDAEAAAAPTRCSAGASRTAT